MRYRELYAISVSVSAVSNRKSNGSRIRINISSLEIPPFLDDCLPASLPTPEAAKPLNQHNSVMTDLPTTIASTIPETPPSIPSILEPSTEQASISV